MPPVRAARAPRTVNVGATAISVRTVPALGCSARFRVDTAPSFRAVIRRLAPTDAATRAAPVAMGVTIRRVGRRAVAAATAPRAAARALPRASATTDLTAGLTTARVAARATESAGPGRGTRLAASSAACARTATQRTRLARGRRAATGRPVQRRTPAVVPVRRPHRRFVRTRVRRATWISWPLGVPRGTVGQRLGSC